MGRKTRRITRKVIRVELPERGKTRRFVVDVNVVRFPGRKSGTYSARACARGKRHGAVCSTAGGRTSAAAIRRAIKLLKG